MLDPRALDALINGQRQLDEDGVFVGVSRQALDEALSELTRLTAVPDDDKTAADIARFYMAKYEHYFAKYETSEAKLATAVAAFEKISAGMEVALHTGETVLMDRDDTTEIAETTLAILRESAS